MNPLFRCGCVLHLPTLSTYTSAVGMISRVRHRQTGVEYALKTIQLDKISARLAKEMRNEIEILKRLDHPNIIRESCGSYSRPALGLFRADVGAAKRCRCYVARMLRGVSKSCVRFDPVCACWIHAPLSAEWWISSPPPHLCPSVLLPVDATNAAVPPPPSFAPPSSLDPLIHPSICPTSVSKHSPCQELSRRSRLIKRFTSS